ncbi:hypothetical protein MCAP1_002096 [Malassezia caprae]|uniref:Major facilitator superfamily (MFS) profile domain-containing protein n=1 Tax=Malassezia caprae TaxID=1381934 RepID=A0AAF0E7Q4_9BASI|nr:hypothetical protein MCAP1_002096 [Malassezia caprae]
MDTKSLDLEQSGAVKSDFKAPSPTSDKPQTEVANLLPTWQPSTALVRRVVRKIDMILIPLMCGCVFLQMSDKMLLNSVSLLGFLTDIHLENKEQFSWISSIFYFGYILGSFGHAYFIQHWVLSQYVSAVVTLWGILVSCHAACHSYSAFLAIRFFLGLMEAAITPSFILMTGRFYTREEQVIRMNIWFSMNGVAQIVAGAATYSELVHTPSTMTMWQNLFLIYGVITFAFGILCFFVMPSSPDTTRYFNEEERSAAVYHIAANQSGIHNSHFKWSQFREAMLDIRLYIYFLGWVCLCIVNGGVTTFGNLIIQSFHYGNKQSALLSMSIGAGETVTVFLGAILFYFLKRRDIIMIGGLLVSAAGAIMIVAIPESGKAARMTGCAIVSFFAVPMPMYYSWQSTTISGTTKRLVFNTSLQIGYAVGNLEVDLSDLTDKERPNYRYPY